MKKVTTKDFENEVIKSEKTVLVDFFATWCGPCRMIAPTLEKTAAEHPEIEVCKIDVDESPELAIRYGVESIPTLIVFEGGNIKNRALGAMPEERILALL